MKKNLTAIQVQAVKLKNESLRRNITLPKNKRFNNKKKGVKS